MSNKAKNEPSGQKERIITQKDLPLSCPMEDMTLWNAHPRVFLPIEETGKFTCPYCGTRYILNSDS